jgi:nitrite reductase/ring-hydroxylating ferredoxin subunit
MAEVLAGRASEFDPEHRKLVTVGGREVVVFKHGEAFYAFENACLHMGGPVGEGVILGKVEAVLGDDGRLLGERFSEDEIHLVCPWHGWEYDIATGRCAGDRKRKLMKFETVLRGEDVYVVGG